MFYSVPCVIGQRTAALYIRYTRARPYSGLADMPTVSNSLFIDLRVAMI